ncbi:group II truncated hemoglobin [Ottowia sp.]|uniref:group II truncated hemoglobin n=1 Tax=Ottowia sp. TaxID=1898956 RepID=UPI003A8BF0A8
MTLQSEADSETSIQATPYQQLGGEAVLRALIERFYDLMDLEPAYAAVRATHGPTLDSARQKLFWFLSGWLGGPDLYVQRFGHPRLRMRHLPFAIGAAERDQWVACMDQAMRELAVAEPLRTQLHHSFFKTADWMCNQGV